MTALYERYAPATLAEVVGQDAAVKVVRTLAQRDALTGRAYWISGKSGQGKTTIGRLLATQVADDFGVTELDAQWLTPARLREIEDSSQVRGWGDKGGKAFIVNEAHGLSSAAIRQLLTMLDRLPKHVVWVFTTTTAAQQSLFGDSIDAGPILSRCVRIELRSDAATSTAFAQRCREIAGREGIDGAPLSVYSDLYYRLDGNMRAMLQALETGEI